MWYSMFLFCSPTQFLLVNHESTLKLQTAFYCMSVCKMLLLLSRWKHFGFILAALLIGQNFMDIDKWLLQPDGYIGWLISYVDIGLAQICQYWHLRSQYQPYFLTVCFHFKEHNGWMGLFISITFWVLDNIWGITATDVYMSANIWTLEFFYNPILVSALKMAYRSAISFSISGQ